MRCPCAGSDILEGSPAGQREAARRALQAQGVEVVSGAMVTKIVLTPSPLQRQQGLPLSNGASTSQPAPATLGGDVAPRRRTVHLKLPGDQTKV